MNTDPKEGTTPAGIIQKGLLILIIAALSTTAIYTLSHLLFARYFHSYAAFYCGNRSIQDSEKTQLDAARACLEQARTWFPVFAEPFFKSDVQRVWATYGDLHYLSTGHAKTYSDYYESMKQAQQCYRNAMALNQWDAVTALGLARATAGVDLGYAALHPESANSPENAEPMFENAIALRPNGVTGLYAFARYLAYKKREGRLRQVLEMLSRVYPPVYSSIKQEPFYNERTREAVKTGLVDAADHGILPRSAHMAISDIYLAEGDPATAAQHYAVSMSLDTTRNGAGNYLRLGDLYLRSAEYEGASDQFMHALRITGSYEADTKRIYSLFAQHNLQEEFLRFVERAKHQIGSYRELDLLCAEALVSMGDLEEAASVLKRLNREFEEPELYYKLARIAEKQKDWNEMELRSHDALRLNPSELRYHALFIKSLMHQNKMPQAEGALTHAINSVKPPPARLYHDRAWLRYRMQLYRGAIEDWERLIEQDPKNAAHYQYIAMAHERQGAYAEALRSIEQALQIDPGNAHYLNIQARLRAEAAG